MDVLIAHEPNLGSIVEMIGMYHRQLTSEGDGRDGLESTDERHSIQMSWETIENPDGVPCQHIDLYFPFFVTVQ